MQHSITFNVLGAPLVIRTYEKDAFLPAVHTQLYNYNQELMLKRTVCLTATARATWAVFHFRDVGVHAFI